MDIETARRVLLLFDLLVLFGLAAFGAHRLQLLFLLYFYPRSPEADPLSMPRDLPRVLVQLPLYNEAAVAARVLRAVAALDYPKDRLEIQVLDDSDDSTSEALAAPIAELRSSGSRIIHHKRKQRLGFKAGALAEGMGLSDARLIAIFDADFVPAPGFLLQLIPYFSEPSIGLVQARWEHLNRTESLLSRLQALLLDAHFRVEQAARSASGRFFNFNGTAGIWRREAIESGGGWSADSLTEDLDLSLRSQLTGWRFLYCDSCAVPAELPSDIQAFRNQQKRWVKGSAQVLQKLLSALWLSPATPLRARIEASAQLFLNLSYLFLLLLALLSVPLVSLGLPLGANKINFEAAQIILMGFASLPVVAFLVAAQPGLTRKLEALLLSPLVMALGFGLALSNSLAWLSGFRSQTGEFQRTPKIGRADSKSIPSGSALATSPPGGGPRDWILPLVEICLGLYCFAGLAAALVHARNWALPFLALEALGFMGFGLASLFSCLRAARLEAPQPFADLTARGRFDSPTGSKRQARNELGADEPNERLEGKAKGGKPLH